MLLPGHRVGTYSKMNSHATCNFFDFICTMILIFLRSMTSGLCSMELECEGRVMKTAIGMH